MEFLRGSNRSFNVCEGSIRSGKTIITLVRWLFFLAAAPEGKNLIMIGRTRATVWDNMIRELQKPELFGELIASEVKGNYLAGSVIILGHKIRVMGASDSSAEKVIRGSTQYGACVDEITTLPYDYFDQLCGRMNEPGAQLFGTTNPDSPSHWFKTQYIDRINDTNDATRLYGFTLWKFTMDDNPSLDPQWVLRQKRKYAGTLFYRRFILGEWCAAAGAIFDFWNPAKHVVDHAKLPRMRRLYATGVDFGVGHASAAIVLGLGVDNVLYFVNEWSYESTDSQARLSGDMQAKRLIAWLGKPLLPHADQSSMKPTWTIVDSAAPEFVLSLKDNGLKGFAAADKAVLTGIHLISNLMQSGGLKVSSECVGLIREIPGYSWDPKAALLGEDKPIKTADDRIDPARYVLLSTMSAWKRDMTANR